METRSKIFTVALCVGVVIGSIWIGQNVNLLPEDASKNAAIYDELFRALFSIGSILFFGIVGLIIYSLIKYRRKPGDDEDGLPIEDNLPLEVLWTAVPTIIVLFVGLYSYDIYDRMGGMQKLSHDMHHSQIETPKRVWAGIGSGSIEDTNLITNEKIPLSIEVSAMQFAFLFHYPQGDIISGELHVPLGAPISMLMESKDVIHAFWVPQFRIKQDIIPGQPTVLNFTATKPGKYPIICAELCGPYHGGMRSTVVVESQRDYIEWFNKNRKDLITEA